MALKLEPLSVQADEPAETGHLAPLASRRRQLLYIILNDVIIPVRKTNHLSEYFKRITNEARKNCWHLITSINNPFLYFVLTKKLKNNDFPCILVSGGSSLKKICIYYE